MITTGQGLIDLHSNLNDFPSYSPAPQCDWVVITELCRGLVVHPKAAIG